MPLATNPKKTLPIWLESDADTPLESRPVFLCRFLTRFEIDSIHEELREIPTIKDVAEAHRQLSALLAKGITGWRNMSEPDPQTGEPKPIDFAPDRFDRVLGVDEKLELGYTMLSAPRLKEKDLGESISSLTSTPDSSAPIAREELVPRTLKMRKSKSGALSSVNAR